MLQNGAETRRLENRAAALLDLLLREKGQLLTHDEIIKEVWDGRFVSPNSVAVVISDIRRALGDDARNPDYIETLPKRGYRLIAATNTFPPEASTSRENLSVSDPSLPNRHRNLVAAFGLTFAFIAVLFVLLSGSGKGAGTRLMVYVTPVEDQTRDAQYAALVPAVSELLSVELAHIEHIQIGTEKEAGIIVGGRLILWDGHPALSLHAISVESGHTLWSGMASGPETLLPRQVRAEIGKLSIAVTNTDF
jgi:DNA-binding winged helix-turn-helix (wHTH) protein